MSPGDPVKPAGHSVDIAAVEKKVTGPEWSAWCYKPRTPNLHLRPDKIAVSTLPETILNQPAGISWSSRTGSFHPPHRKSPGLKITLLLLLLAPTIMARVMG